MSYIGMGMVANTKADRKRQSYEAYLNSDHWRELRQKAFKIYGKRCLLCESTEVHGHHLVYRNLTDVHPAEVVPLCQKHHSLVHDIEDAGALGAGYSTLSYRDKIAIIRNLREGMGDTVQSTLSSKDRKRAKKLARKAAKRLSRKRKSAAKLAAKLAAQHKTQRRFRGPYAPSKPDATAWIKKFTSSRNSSDQHSTAQSVTPVKMV